MDVGLIVVGSGWLYFFGLALSQSQVHCPRLVFVLDFPSLYDISGTRSLTFTSSSLFLLLPHHVYVCLHLHLYPSVSIIVNGAPKSTTTTARRARPQAAQQPPQPQAPAAGHQPGHTPHAAEAQINVPEHAVTAGVADVGQGILTGHGWLARAECNGGGGKGNASEGERRSVGLFVALSAGAGAGAGASVDLNGSTTATTTTTTSPDGTSTPYNPDSENTESATPSTTTTILHHTNTTPSSSAIAAYLTSLSNMPTLRTNRLWKCFVRVQTDTTITAYLVSLSNMPALRTNWLWKCFVR
ncbi:hypothetical protein CVT25_010180, partial [Psilocybe cyanescens]